MAGKGGWIAGVLVLSAAITAFADDDEHGHGQAHHGDNGEVSVEAGSTVVNKHSGISVAGSDMEIDDGLATWSALFGLAQGTNINPVIAADTLNRQGKYEAAAKMLCSTKKYKKVYGKGKTCIDTIKLKAPTKPENETVPDEENELRYMAQQEELENVKQQVAVLVGQVQEQEQEQQRQHEAPAAQQQVQQQPYSDKQREAIKEIFK
jgi:hypothetical protein